MNKVVRVLFNNNGHTSQSTAKYAFPPPLCSQMAPWTLAGALSPHFQVKQPLSSSDTWCRSGHLRSPQVPFVFRNSSHTTWSWAARRPEVQVVYASCRLVSKVFEQMDPHTRQSTDLLFTLALNLVNSITTAITSTWEPQVPNFKLALCPSKIKTLKR